MRFLAVAALLMLASGADAAKYSITDLGSLGGPAQAQAINSHGQVVGYSYIGETFSPRAFLYDGISMRNLGVLGGSWSEASAINNLGQIVGHSSPATGSAHRAFLSDGTTMVDIGTLGGPRSFARGINDVGQITGYSDVTSGGPVHAFLYADGAMRDLGTLGGTRSDGMAINSRGHVAGSSHILGDTETHAMLFDGTVMRDLGTLGGTWSQAYAVNDAGHVVGQSNLAGDEFSRAFYFDGIVMHDLGSLGDGTFSMASDINNSGQVVGGFVIENAYDGTRGFLYSGGITYDLNELIDPLSDWLILDASGINDRGQIIATASRKSSGFEQRAILLTPSLPGGVPEPSSWALMIAGFGLVGVAARRGQVALG